MKSTDRYSSLKKNYQQLTKELAPVRDLWQDIEKKLHPVQQQNRWKQAVYYFQDIWLPYRLAAAVILVITIGLSFFTVRQQLNHQDLNSIQYRQVVKELENSAKEYRQAKEKILKILKTNESVIDPYTVSAVRENILIIENAVSEIETALGNGPANQQLASNLDNIYYEETRMLLQSSSLLEGITSGLKF